MPPTRCGPPPRVRDGAALWPFVLAAPLAYLALPFLFTCIWMAFGWWWRAPAPAEVALSFRQKLRLFANEFASLARSPLRMTFYWLLRDPATGARRPARPASARRRLQRRRLVGNAARSRGARDRARVHDVVRPAARVDRALRGPARREDRGHPRGDRRRAGRDRHAQHGRARGTRLSSPLRRRARAAAGHAGRAAPRAAGTRG